MATNRAWPYTGSTQYIGSYGDRYVACISSMYKMDMDTYQYRVTIDGTNIHILFDTREEAVAYAIITQALLESNHGVA